MMPVYGKPLITEAALHARVQELGEAITRDYEGKDLLVVGILKGAFIFLADLVRAIRIPLQVDFMMVSSYGLRDTTSGKVHILLDLSEEIQDRDVLVVEDIVDSGLTLAHLLEHLQARKPRSLRTCVLLDKRERRQRSVPLHYVGFTIPNKFVVGYGLDYQNRFRTLPYVAVLEDPPQEAPPGGDPGGLLSGKEPL